MGAFKSVRSSAFALACFFLTGPAIAELAPLGFPLREPCYVPGAAELRELYGADNLSAGAKEIMELEWEACRMFGNLDTFERAYDLIFSPGTNILHANGPIVSGEKNKELFKQYFARGHDMKFEPIYAKVYEAENVAWVFGVLDETKPDGSVERGKYVAIWERIDGKWLNIFDMRNGNGGVPLISH